MAAAVAMSLLTWTLLEQKESELSDVWKQQFNSIKADLTLEDVKYSRFTSAGRKWIVYAGRARLYEDHDRMDLDNVTITFLNSDHGRITVVSDMGSYDREKNLLCVKKNVIVKFRNGERLYADILNYSQEKQVIWSKEPVILKRDDGLVIKGKSMEYQVSKGLLILKDQESVIPESGFYDG